MKNVIRKAVRTYWLVKALAAEAVEMVGIVLREQRMSVFADFRGKHFADYNVLDWFCFGVWQRVNDK